LGHAEGPEEAGVRVGFGFEDPDGSGRCVIYFLPFGEALNKQGFKAHQDGLCAFFAGIALEKFFFDGLAHLTEALAERCATTRHKHLIAVFDKDAFVYGNKVFFALEIHKRQKPRNKGCDPVLVAWAQTKRAVG
jgi:hypothetical protein